MNEQAMRFRIGIFVLAALIALGVLVILFGGRPYFFLPSTTYTIQFDNAQGVAPGTPVRRSGVKIGEVRRVSLDDSTGKVEVVIQIEDGHKVHKSDRPTLTQSILGGDAVIAFLPPPDKKDIDNTPVEPGKVIEGFSQVDAGQLIPPAEEALKVIKKSLEQLTPEAQDALREIRIAVPRTSETIQDAAKKLTPTTEKLLERIDKMVPGLEKTSDEIRDAARNFNKMVPNLEKTVDEFRDVARSVNKMAPKVEKAVDEINDLVKTVNKTTLPDFRRTMDEIQVLVRNWNKVGERVDLFMRTNEDKLTRTVERTEEALKRINETFSDENQINVRETLKNIRASSDRFDGIAKSTDELLKDSRATLKQFNESMQKVDAMMVDLQKSIKPLADRSDSIVKNIEQTTEKLNHTLTDVRELLKKVTQGNGTLQKLLVDPSLYNNLNEASLRLSCMMPRLDHILRDVEIFADKLARHPELLGVRGAIAPGAGTKEAPAPYGVFPLPYPP